jgi:hypothetical protein
VTANHGDRKEAWLRTNNLKGKKEAGERWMVASARYTLDHLYLLNAVCVNKDKGMTAGGAQVADRS